jgi:uncharacterized protein (TIRG00374 family)
VFGVLLLVIVLAMLLDRRQVLPALRQAQWRLLLPALLCTALSYAGSSTGFAIINRAFGLALPASRLALVGFVNMAANNLITLGGAAGYSVSVVLLKDPETEHRTILAASLFNTWLYFIFGTSLLPLSLLYLLLRHRLTPGVQTGLWVVTAGALVLAVVVNLAVFRPGVRGRLLAFLARLLKGLFRRDLAGTFARFNDAFSQGLAALRAAPGRLAALGLALVGDWAFCLAALWFALAALGVRLSPGVLVSGFIISIAAGAASMIPGGLGVQEGSLAGVYALLGAPITHAALGAVLFRVVYYLLPFALGLMIYWRALRIRTTHEGRT